MNKKLCFAFAALMAVPGALLAQEKSQAQATPPANALTGIWNKTKRRKPDDFVFATRNGTPTERRNVLRHVKAAAKALGLPKEVDFRSFRTLHASLMRRSGARAEVARDNMGHSEIPTTLEIYSKTWWDERKTAVSAVVDLVMNSDMYTERQVDDNQRQPLFVRDEKSEQLAPQLAPQH